MTREDEGEAYSRLGIAGGRMLSARLSPLLLRMRWWMHAMTEFVAELSLGESKEWLFRGKKRDFGLKSTYNVWFGRNDTHFPHPHS